MVVDLKTMAELEMQAYDSLPPALKLVFDRCPRKVSVLQVMRLPNVRKALCAADPEDLAKILSAHFAEQVKAEVHITT